MQEDHRLTPRQRWMRVAGGLGLMAAGVIAFAVSDALDPANRAAILTILAILVGGSMLGQGIRGVHDGPIHREVPPPTGRPVPPVARLRGLVLAWLVPGLGHWSIGRRGKGALFFVVISATFLAGAWLGRGRIFGWEDDWIYFLAYGWNGGETLLAWAACGDLERDRPIEFLQMGYLYAAVGGLLNLVAIMDYEASAGRGYLPALPDGAPEPGGDDLPLPSDEAPDGDPDVGGSGPDPAREGAS